MRLKCHNLALNDYLPVRIALEISGVLRHGHLSIRIQSSDTMYGLAFILFPPLSFDLVLKGGIWLCFAFTYLAKIPET